MATEASFESIQQALSAIVKPLSDSVGGLNTKFDDHRVQTAERLARIQADLTHVRAGHTELQGQVTKIREDHAECVARANWPLVEKLIQRDENTANFRMSQPTTKKSDPSINIPLPKSAIRWIPYLIISAFLGAAVVGAALVGRVWNPIAVPAAQAHVAPAPKPAPEDGP